MTHHIMGIPREFEILLYGDKTNSNVKQILLQNTEDNHYKEYLLSQEKHLEQNWNGHTFLAEWGRIGVKRKQSKVYKTTQQLTMWDQMNAKLKKGYKVKDVLLFSDVGKRTLDTFLASLGNYELF